MSGEKVGVAAPFVMVFPTEGQPVTGWQLTQQGLALLGSVGRRKPAGGESAPPLAGALLLAAQAQGRSVPAAAQKPREKQPKDHWNSLHNFRAAP